MTLIIRCAEPGCDASRVVPSSSDVLGAMDPFERPQPMVGASGWRFWADRYVCPAHRDAPQRYARLLREHDNERDRAREQWDIDHPRPPIPGVPWDGGV